MNVGDRCGLRAKEGIGKKQTREEGEIRKMSVFRRGKVYWFSFVFNGQRIQQSTKQSNRKAAIDIESAYRTKLAKGEVGIEERKPAPTFREFSKRFIAHMKIWCKDKPKTFEFWEDMTNGLLEFEPLASARLDKIDEALLARFVARDSKVSIATVNRRLATLRRALRLAYEWRLLNRLPRIHMMPGEKRREYVLTAKDREVSRRYGGTTALPRQVPARDWTAPRRSTRPSMGRRAPRSSWRSLPRLRAHQERKVAECQA
jgi:hypothetical protein